MALSNAEGGNLKIFILLFRAMSDFQKASFKKLYWGLMVMLIATVTPFKLIHKVQTQSLSSVSVRQSHPNGRDLLRGGQGLSQPVLRH